jgi:hypothetical protein
MIDRWEEIRRRLMTGLDEVGYLTLSSYYPKEKTSTQVGRLDPHNDQALALLIAGPQDLVSDSELDAVRAALGNPSAGYGNGTLLQGDPDDVPDDAPDDEPEEEEEEPEDDPGVEDEDEDEDDEDDEEGGDENASVVLSASHAVDLAKERHAERKQARQEEEAVSFTIEERVEGIRLWLNSCARSNTAPGTRTAFRLRAHQLKGTPLWSIIVSYNALHERTDNGEMDAVDILGSEPMMVPTNGRHAMVPVPEQVTFLASPPPAAQSVQNPPAVLPPGFLPRAKNPDQAMRLASVHNTEIVTINALHATTRELLAMMLNATSTLTSIQGRALKQTAASLEDARDHNAQLLEMIGIHSLAEAELLAKTKLAEVGETTKETLGSKAIEQLGSIGKLLVKGRQAMTGARAGASPIEAASNALDAATEPADLGPYLQARPDLISTLNDPSVRAYLRNPENVPELRRLARMMTGTGGDDDNANQVLVGRGDDDMDPDVGTYEEPEDFYDHDLSDTPEQGETR